MKNIVFPLLLGMLFWMGCRSDTPNSGQGGEISQSASSNEIPATSIKLLCQAVETPNDNVGAPQHEVYLQMGNSRIKVGDILSCETIARDAYEQYQIPTTAIDAAGGWWAGAGDYFYVAEEGGNYVVKQGAMFEEKTDNSYDYKTIMTFSKEGKEVF